MTDQTHGVTAEAYSRVFVQHHEGALILEDLTARFYDKATYVPGGIEGQRETERRAAQRDVLQYIFTKLGQVGKIDPNEA